MIDSRALWVLDTQADWQAGEVAAVDVATVPGSVVLARKNLVAAGRLLLYCGSTSGNRSQLNWLPVAVAQNSYEMM